MKSKASGYTYVNMKYEIFLQILSFFQSTAIKTKRFSPTS